MTSIPAKTKLAIFDIDGTLTDSVFVHQKAFHSALRNAQLTPYDDDFSYYLKIRKLRSIEFWRCWALHNLR